MKKKNEDLLVSVILNSIPGKVKPVPYLMDLLGLSSESVYRRIRGIIPFSFDEVSKLSLTLNFSIDEVVGQAKDKRIFFDLQGSSSSDPKEMYMNMLENYLEHVVAQYKTKKTESVMTMNRLWDIFTVGYDNLFKFYYYKWIHQVHEVPLNYYYSEIVVPPEILNIYKEIKSQMNIIPDMNITFILDREIFLNTIREIRYYYKRKLINDDEMLLIQKDLRAIVEDAERFAQRGTDEFGAKYFYYVSVLDIESNTSYTTFDDIGLESNFWIYSVSPLRIKNAEVCIMHKRWLDSLKKYSTFISQSNEILQADFFGKQHEYINNIMNMDLYNDY